MIFLIGVVCVGGCCSEKLKSCVFKSWWDDVRKKKEILVKIVRVWFKVRDDFRVLFDDGFFEWLIVVLKCLRRGVFFFCVLKYFMFCYYVRWFENEVYRGIDDLLLDWLGVKIVVLRDFREKNDCNGVYKEDFRM